MLEFEEVYAWLNYKEDKSYLSDPVSQIIEQIKINLNGGSPDTSASQDFLQVNKLIALSVEISESLTPVSGNLAKAEAYFECAYASYKMLDITRSIAEFRRAIGFYRAVHEHNEAVTRWLIGCAYWKRAQQSEAIVEWETSCNLFKSLRETRNIVWYQTQLDKMCATMSAAIQHGRWPYPESTGEPNEPTP